MGTGDGNHTLTERFGVRCLTPTATATATPPCSTGWNVISSPNVLTASNTLNGVVATGSADAWAVGSSSNAAHTLAMRWNGGYWLTVSTPDGGTVANELLGGYVLAANNVWAVGYATNPQPETLVLHWDGISWARVLQPQRRDRREPALRGRRPAANDIWAVGSYVSGTGDEQTLIEHWNGTAWSVVASRERAPKAASCGASPPSPRMMPGPSATPSSHEPTPTATATTFAGERARAGGQSALARF